MSDRRRRPATGLTLLEVLAAVLLLGMFSMVVGRAAIQGLRAEGDARRRIGASLVADRVLADAEIAIEQGAPPPAGLTETTSEDELYRITLEVSPLALDLAETEEGRSAAPTGAPGAGSLIGGSGGAEASLLRTVEVQVTWDEGFGERSVRRTTFAFDRAAGVGALTALDAAAEQAAAAAAGAAANGGAAGAGAGAQ